MGIENGSYMQYTAINYTIKTGQVEVILRLCGVKMAEKWVLQVKSWGKLGWVW